MLRVLFLTHRLPYAPNRGDRLRAYHILHALAACAEVHLISLVHDADEAREVASLRSLVSSVRTAAVPRMRNLARAATSLPTARPLTHALLDSPAMTSEIRALVAECKPDVVLAYCSGMAKFALQPPLAGTPLVIDMVDADSAKWRDLAAASRPPRSWIYAREARVLGAFEAGAMRVAVTTLVVTERERALLAAAAPDADIRVVQNGVDLEAFRPAAPPTPSTEVVFCGVLDYAPNAAGAVWLAREVWPRLRKSMPEAVLTLVGAHPTPAVRGLASTELGIIVTGSVPDVRPYLWRAAAATAPLHVARGVQNKALEAVAAGLPCVVTEPVWEGLPSEIRSACVLAPDAESFARALENLLRLPPGERRTISERADVDALHWSRRLHSLPEILANAAARLRPA